MLFSQLGHPLRSASCSFPFVAQLHTHIISTWGPCYSSAVSRYIHLRTTLRAIYWLPFQRYTVSSNRCNSHCGHNANSRKSVPHGSSRSLPNAPCPLQRTPSQCLPPTPSPSHPPFPPLSIPPRHGPKTSPSPSSPYHPTPTHSSPSSTSPCQPAPSWNPAPQSQHYTPTSPTPFPPPPPQPHHSPFHPPFYTPSPRPPPQGPDYAAALPAPPAPADSSPTP